MWAYENYQKEMVKLNTGVGYFSTPRIIGGPERISLEKADAGPQAWANYQVGARFFYNKLMEERKQEEMFQSGALSFRNGGSFMVPGTGAADSRRVSLNVTPGETISVRTRQQQGGDDGGGKTIIINMTVNAADVDSFKRSERQIQSDTLARMTRALDMAS
jgi:hypothetical protein